MAVGAVLCTHSAKPPSLHCHPPPGLPPHCRWLQACRHKVKVGPKWHNVNYHLSHKNAYSIKSNMSPSCSCMSTTVFEGLCTTKLLYGCQFMLVRLLLLLLTVNCKCGTPGAPTGS